jgi:cytochrome c oxidase subunit III
VTLLGVVVAFMASFLFAYFLLRLIADEWPPVGLAAPSLGRAILASGILGASGVAMVVADVAARRGQQMLLVLGLCGGGVTALGFLAAMGADLWLLDFTARTNAFGSAFFAVAILQMVLVAGGAFGFGLVLARALKRHFSSERHVAVRTLSVYWYFVVLTWPVMFGVLYLFPRLA